MADEPHVLIVNGSYREGGISDQMAQLILKRLQNEGIGATQLLLRDTPIEFCTNCRNCVQSEGEAPGRCVIDDGMVQVIEQIETAAGYVFISPTNMGTVTAIFKRFLERLTVYGYWPWGKPAPTLRKNESKAALCLSSCAAPSLIAQLLYGTMGVLKQTARCVGAKVVDTLMIGLIAGEEHPHLGEGDAKRVDAVTKKLIAALKQA